MADDESLEEFERADPWELADAEPTTLVALWPHDEPPTMTEVRAAMADHLGSPVQEVDEMAADDPEILWSMVIEVPGCEEPVVIWAEPARPLSPDDLDDPRALACRWIVGAETLLDEDDPLRSFTAVMRLLAGSVVELPAVLDVNSGRWHPRDSLVELFLADGIEPSEDLLWLIHVVSDDGARSGTWLHTHGLWRCGRPELEMIEVPATRIDRSCELLNAIAGRLLEEEMPEPGERFEVGRDMEVTLQRWQDVAPYMAEHVPGGLQDRPDDDEVHTGVRAVVCGAQPRGAYRKVFGWPGNIVDQLESGDGLLFLSRRSTERSARQARTTWPQLATSFASLPAELVRNDAAAAEAEEDGRVRFIIKAGFPPDATADEQREHMWFVVRRFNGDRAEAILINQPVAVPDLHRGDVIWIDRATVSDWMVVTPLGSFDPSRSAALERAIDRIRET